MTSLLAARDLYAGWGHVPVVHELDIDVDAGEVVALLGPNGAGKSTSLRTLAGTLPKIRGSILWAGKPIPGPQYRRAKAGLAFVAEDRSIFPSLSARDNLRVGRCDMSFALELFPQLGDLLGRPAGLLSGGEQQMLTLARAIARRPKVLLVDELSLGLAPIVTGRLLEGIRAAADAGLGVLLVEQHVSRVLEIADHVHVLGRGRVAFSGTADETRASLSEIEASYLGSQTTGG